LWVPGSYVGNAPHEGSRDGGQISEPVINLHDQINGFVIR